MKLPQNWLQYVLVLFKKVLAKETTLGAWSKVILMMLHKKCDKQDPGNYRGITLVICITKLFTQILCDRLALWAKSVTLSRNCLQSFLLFYFCGIYV